MISSIAKTIATFVTYPILTIRVKMQASHQRKEMGLFKFLMSMLHDVGIKGLYLGVFAKLVQTVLYNGFLMITYEKLRRLIKYLLVMYFKKRYNMRGVQERV